MEEQNVPPSAIRSAFIYDLINKAVSHRLFGRHEVVSLTVSFDLGYFLPSVLCKNGVELVLYFKDLLSLDLDISALALTAS